MSKRVTTFWADKHGFFQGTPTPGEAVDSGLRMLGLKKLPPVASIAKAWPRWVEGKDQPIDDAWLNDMIAQGQLPERESVNYSCAEAERAELGEQRGTCVIVQTLDSTAQTRHRLKMHGGILVATPVDRWEALKGT